jgi:hypothetical protein
VLIALLGVSHMQAELETIAKRSVPYAARETLNSMAFEGRAFWQEQMRSSLHLRNKFTERRALVDRARGLRMSTMEAILGHTEPYMALTERGGTNRAKSHVRAIPTEAAAGQAKGSLAGGRKRTVRPALLLKRLSALRVPGGKARSRKQQNARAIGVALRSGRRLALLDMGRRKGIYRIKGSKRRPEVVKLYDLSRRSTPVPRTPTLGPAVARVNMRGPLIAIKALERQLARARGGS